MNARSTLETSRTHSRRANARPGFSLLELTLVLAIIGILVAMVAVNIAGAGDRAKTKTTKAALEVIASQLKAYHLEYSSYPTSLEVLKTAKFLDASKSLNDGWDTPIVYEPRPSGNEKFTLFSTGGDKLPSTEDDIPYGVAPQ